MSSESPTFYIIEETLDELLKIGLEREAKMKIKQLTPAKGFRKKYTHQDKFALK